MKNWEIMKDQEQRSSRKREREDDTDESPAVKIQLLEGGGRGLAGGTALDERAAHEEDGLDARDTDPTQDSTQEMQVLDTPAKGAALDERDAQQVIGNDAGVSAEGTGLTQQLVGLGLSSGDKQSCRKRGREEKRWKREEEEEE